MSALEHGILERDSHPHEDVHDVLWTSGWDSTFRVLDLLSQGKVVRPWYVVAEEYPRPSTKTELETMRKIRMELAERDPAVREQLLPLHVVKESDLPKRTDIDLAVRRLRKKYGTMATQYEFLASLADTVDMTLEMGLHKGGLAEVFLKGQTEQDPETGEITLKVDADPDMRLVFGRMAFPISPITKREMGEIAEAKGFSDIMDQTWFCSTPVLGKPCGHCSPCRTALRTGMGERVGKPTALKRLGYNIVRWKSAHPPKTIKLELYRAAMRLRDKVGM